MLKMEPSFSLRVDIAFQCSKGSIENVSVIVADETKKAATHQEIPSSAGFVIVTGSKPVLLTTADYYSYNTHPVTD